MWLLCAPAEDMTVVSEIGDTWSPHTAPASTADTEMIIICILALPVNILVAIGTRIANVPHDVPVENDRNTAAANRTAVIKMLAEALSPTDVYKRQSSAHGPSFPCADLTGRLNPRRRRSSFTAMPRL